MKRIFSIMMVLVAIAANAQDSRSRFHIGAKAGLTILDVYDVDAGNFKSAKRGGFVGGVFLQIPLGKAFGIQPEVLYSQKGTNGIGSINGVEYTLKRTANSLDIPLMLQFKPLKFINIVAGPQLSYLLSQKDVYDDPENTVIRQQFSNQEYRKANLGLVGGMDINIGHLILSGRVGCDLQKNTTNNTLAPSYKNLWGQAAVGFRF